ncbi:hypothetical protein [Anaerotignum sp.]|uniref:hypothetical protein n=1 Tax=Anaerotignum sp. TaxID=2039241 RepID=UPI0028A1744D|nr:hypothetical protein [Anaerotignum sp.]
MERILLGSGDVFCLEYIDTIPEYAEIETKENLLAEIQGGVVINYDVEWYDAEVDSGRVSKSFIKKETAVLKTGIATLNGNTIKKLCSTARVTEDKEKKTRTVKIGGAGNFDGKKYLIHFLHKDAADGNVRVTIVGNNQAPIEFAFAKDKETVVNTEFKATALDDEGTLVIFNEEDKTIA